MASWSSLNTTFPSSSHCCKYLCGLIVYFVHVPFTSHDIYPVPVCTLSLMISSSLLLTLEVSALSSSLLTNKSQNLILSLYSDSEGTTPTQQLYIEAFLCEDFHINHFKILDTAPLILKAELSLYFTAEGGLAE